MVEKDDRVSSASEGLKVSKEDFAQAFFNTATMNEAKKLQTGFLCMFSGGLDSTALLHALLKNPAYKDYKVFVHHIRLANREQRGPAELQAVRQIIKHYHDDPTVRKFDYKETGYDASALSAQWSQRFSFDMDVAAFVAAQVCLARPDIKYVGIGVTKDDFDDASDFSKERYLACPKIFNAHLYSFEKMFPKPQLIYPLKTLTKEQLWRSIPPNVRNMTWSCRRPVWKDNKPIRCGKCHTCVARKDAGIDP